MTTPNVIDQYGLGSPSGQAQLAAFNAMRDSVLQQLMARQYGYYGMTMSPAGYPQAQPSYGAAQPQGVGQPPQSSQPSQGLTQPQTQTIAQPQAAQLSPQSTDDELLGAARFWGIPEEVASQMPRDHLADIINQYRASTRPAEDTAWQRLQAEPWGLAAMGLSAATGAGEALVGGIQHLPVIGEALSRVHAVHAADQWLHSVDEGLRASTPASMNMALNLGGDVGGAGAMILPISATWALAGKIAGGSALWTEAFGPTAGPIARAAGMLSAQAMMLSGRWATEPFTSPILNALQGQPGQGSYGSQVEQYAQSHYQQLMGGLEEQNLATVLGGAAEGVMQRYGPQLRELSNRVFSRLGPVQVPSAGIPTAASSDMEIPTSANQGQGPQTASDFFSAADTPNPHINQLRAMASNGDPQAQAMLDAIGGMNSPMEIPMSGTPATGVELPQSGAGRSGTTTTAVASALQQVGPDEFRRMVNAEIAARGGATSPEVEMAATEQVARNLASGTPAPLPISNINPYMRRAQGLDVESALANAAQMNKAGQAIEGPALPEVARTTAPNDATVGAAAMLNNPGGVNVLQGIDPPTLVNQLGAYSQFVQRGTRIDALISDFPISDQMVNEYEQHGYFVGQSALLPNGAEGRITSIGDGIVGVKPHFGGVEFYVKPEDIMPRTNTAGSTGGEAMWNNFNDYANSRTQATADAMGGAMTPDQLVNVRTTNLPTYMRDWFETNGISELGDQSRIRNFFNMKYVDSLKELVQPEYAMAEQAQAAVASMPQAGETPLGNLDKAAATKGFVVVPDYRTGSYTVQDAAGVTGSQTPSTITFSSQDAAEAWVKNFDRQLPDISPPNVVPGEVLNQSMPTEPTQLPNANHLEAEAGVNAINHTQALDDEMRGWQARAEVLQGTGKLEQMNNEYTRGIARLEFMSTLFRNMDTGFRNAGLDLGIEGDRAALLGASDKMHNFEQPILQELAGINAQVRPSLLQNGTYFQTYQIEDPAARLAAAQAAGMTPSEIATFEQRGDVYKRLFGQTGLDPQREVANYMSWVAKRQSMGNPQPWNEFAGLTNATQPFFEYVRGSDMDINSRIVDPRILDRMYVRSLGWKNYMNDIYPAVAQKYKSIGEQIPTMQPATDVMGNWLKIMKYGYRAEDEGGRQLIHGMIRYIPGMSGVTEGQANMIFNGAMNNTYNSLLGFQPHILARDGLRLLFAAPKVGTDLGTTIAKYIASPAAREDMWKFAIDNGISRPGQPVFNRPFDYSENLPMYAEDATQRMSNTVGDVSSLPNKNGALLRAGEAIHSWIMDRLPVYFRDPTPGALSPMYWVGKQAETMRMLVGNAMYNKTTNAIADYATHQDMGTLLSDSGMSTLKEASRNLFTRMVQSGDTNGAAVYAARQMVDDTMFRYGSLETPMAVRSTFGRLFMQMGNFSEHVWQYANDGLKNGTLMDRVKFGASALGVFAGLDALDKQIGWNFAKMNPFVGAGFSGGPWIQPVLDIYGGVDAAVHELGNDPQQQDAEAFGTAGRALGDVATMMNPAGGLIRTGQRVVNALASPLPSHALARAFITGEPGIQQDWNTMMLPQTTQMFQNSQHMMPSPVRAGAYGTQYVPQQTPTYPQGFVGPYAPGMPPSGPQYPVAPSPAPGGQSYAPRPANGSSGPVGAPRVDSGPQYQPYPNSGPHGAQF